MGEATAELEERGYTELTLEVEEDPKLGAYIRGTWDGPDARAIRTLAPNRSAAPAEALQDILEEVPEAVEDFHAHMALDLLKDLELEERKAA